MIVGIAGGSCSGKTTLSNEIIRQTDASVGFSFDEYLKRKYLNPNHPLLLDPSADWETPKRYRIGRFVRDLEVLKNGGEVQIKTASRESRQRGIDEIAIAALGRHVVVEGFLIFHGQGAVEQFDKRVFVDLSREEMLRRKLARTAHKDPAVVTNYFNNQLWPGYQQYVSPQREYAELILDGTEPVDVLARQVLSYVSGSLEPKLPELSLSQRPGYSSDLQNLRSHD